MAETTQPAGLLFDIGGVCVLSPFQAILDYEIANKIPPGWVNFSISRSAPSGSWHRLERGEIKLDAAFFKEFNKDLSNPDLWQKFHETLRKKQSTTGAPSSSSSSSSPLPPLPQLDAEFLFWEMMRISRAPDPYMAPALKKLKASGKFILGALSNTVVFPDGHPYNKDESGVKGVFDFFISSAHTGLRKPDPKIYEFAIREMNRLAREKGLREVGASDIVFFDDIGENLKGAKKAGMRTVKVNLGRTQDAVKELEKITGLSLLEGSDRARL
ncbi:epoxide hydrolase [Aspergillus nomiae NRRL 13137]|uniref:Epoxide hydrolase n=1 Tax=Aspergillus nomiae NRRL (strain ATCC 15546 / NRRL 13137 / CBS 260.88 / M93) TaxID=1509407 RepID=A0A0L1JEC5_ASPN3|nr:epoxide hydrolase [Aspergillus nomiae NRRL 13137]KNG90022.1 epoxide hydrolase [Aspergillus nomiae NRRL 13137]